MIRKIHLAAMSKSICLATMLLAGTVLATTAKSATGPYFGQTPPGSTPQIFAPGIISLTNRLEGGITFSPDGNECYFTVWGANYSSDKIFYTKRENNIWTPQVEATFSIGHYNGNPIFSIDGNKLYFTRSGPEPTDIWMVQRTSQGWSNPQVLPSPINSSYSDYGCIETADGTAYFNSNRPGGKGNVDIWRIRQVPGQPLQAENLTAVNSTVWEGSSCVAPDGSYIIFTSERPGGQSYSNLYVSFQDSNGSFTTPVNLNNYIPGINISGIVTTTDASLSPDGRYLFFVRYNRPAGEETRDVYWVANPFYVPEPAMVIQLGLAAIMLGLAGIRRFHSGAM